MKLLYGHTFISELKQGSVATIGNFDGVHLGHQALLAQLRTEADRLGLPLLVVLFEPQPSEYFRGKNASARLSRLREKIIKLRECGVDYVYCLKFNQNIALMKADDFVREILISTLSVKHLLVGNDFRFGRDREGDVSLLKTLGHLWGCTVQTFSDFMLGTERISSTSVRHALQCGELNVSERLLGKPYSLCGRVIQGDGIGRQWGVPTANLKVHRLLLPLKGVFCVQVVREGRPPLKGVANLGNRPTLEGNKNVLEVHLFDFNESLYGERIQVFFLHKLRDEMKFSSIEDLIENIHKDVVIAKNYFLNTHIPCDQT